MTTLPGIAPIQPLTILSQACEITIMTMPFSRIEYLAPSCFSTDDGLHFSPLVMEISVNVGGDWIAMTPIRPGIGAELAENLSLLREGCLDQGLDVDIPGTDDDFVRRVDAACAALTLVDENSIVDSAEWESHIARHGTDDWPPAIQSRRDGLLDAAADVPGEGLFTVASLVWQHTLSRTMDTKALLVDDRQYFESGLPKLCPDRPIHAWSDLLGGREGQSVDALSRA